MHDLDLTTPQPYALFQVLDGKTFRFERPVLEAGTVPFSRPYERIELVPTAVELVVRQNLVAPTRAFQRIEPPAPPSRLYALAFLTSSLALGIAIGFLLLR